MDGSPPAYHMDKGFGAGINNWLVHIEVLENLFVVLFHDLYSDWLLRNWRKGKENFGILSLPYFMTIYFTVILVG